MVCFIVNFDLVLILVKGKYGFSLDWHKATYERTLLHPVLISHTEQWPGADHYCSRIRLFWYENISVVPVVIKKKSHIARQKRQRMSLCQYKSLVHPHLESIRRRAMGTMTNVMNRAERAQLLISPFHHKISGQ